MKNFNRRQFVFATAAATLAACDTSPVAANQTAALPPDLRPTPNNAFDAYVATVRPRALRQGISSSVFDRAFAGAGYLPGVVRRDRNQAETNRTLEDYLSITVSEERVTQGRAVLARHRAVLAAIEERFAVPATIVAAIWGIESRFGAVRGQVPVISSTATLAADGRRGAFFEKQLIAALQILENGDTTPANLVGSWAGAMGHTQFIPTSYQAFAVDFTGDGRRDIWSDDPSDALASAAAYLNRNGWQKGLRWGGEVGSGAPAGRTIQPQAGGARFSVTRNFNVIKRYNNSDLYAIAVGHLSDRIAGAGPLQSSFPADENGLSKADRIAVQQGLVARGFDVGTIDGVIGARTEAAIRTFQQRNGMAVTGTATRDLLNAL